jgi:hypothetical protein
MSRKARVLSLSKSFMEGISPDIVTMILQLADGKVKNIPLMILQKIQAAAILFRCDVVVGVRFRWSEHEGMTRVAVTPRCIKPPYKSPH